MSRARCAASGSGSSPATGCASTSPPTPSIARASSTATADSRPRPVSELDLIEQLESVFGTPGARVIRGLGDDAAVVRGGGYAVTSVDAMIDGVHFRSAQLPPEDIGHRALAGALSDLAAMGAAAGEAYLALGLPTGYDSPRALRLARGAQALAESCGVTIAGGDVTSAPALTVSFT